MEVEGRRDEGRRGTEWVLRACACQAPTLPSTSLLHWPYPVVSTLIPFPIDSRWLEFYRTAQNSEESQTLHGLWSRWVVWCSLRIQGRAASATRHIQNDLTAQHIRWWAPASVRVVGRLCGLDASYFRNRLTLSLPLADLWSRTGPPHELSHHLT